MSSQGKVVLEIIGVVWGVFMLFMLGVAVVAWRNKRGHRRRKGHRRKHRDWD